ncbi:MAG: hypothetical protein PHS42_01775 [Sulfurimonas sp.]|nr:hypothetical protein [Sulfurimonas sp.]MDD3834178.1 hypothetical protein [Sulfurimonas sp.]
MSTISVYFFNSLAALRARNESQDSDTIFFYDGEPLKDAPSNCINVPIGTFYDYFLKTAHPLVTQINFDNVDFSDEVKSQITQSITDTVVAIQNDKVGVINALLPAEINEQNVTVMIFSFLKHLLECADEKVTLELITKLLKIITFLKTHSYKKNEDINKFLLKLSTTIHTDELSMKGIFLNFILQNLENNNVFQSSRILCLEQVVKHKEMADVFNHYHYIKNIYPQNEFKEYIYNLAQLVFSDNFFDLEIIEQKERVYKFFYCTNNTYDFSKDFQEIYKILYPIYVKAIEKELDELIMFLYYPLQFSWNSVAQTQDEHKQFNDAIELKLESFIKNYVMPKYELKANTRIIKPNQKKIKVAFLVHRILNLSVNDVMISLLKALKENPNSKFEFIVYDFNLMEMLGSDQKEVAKLKGLGFSYIDLHVRYTNNNYPLYSIVEKSLKVRQILIDDKIDILIGYHNRAEYNFLFTSRTAPIQIYWSHGNNEYNISGIDTRILNNAEALLYPSAKVQNFVFNLFTVPTKTYDLNIDIKKIQDIKKDFPKETIFLGSIGRLVKLENERYLKAVAQIMKRNPNTVYLACGSGDKSYIMSKIYELGIEDRFYFTGHIDPNVYNMVLDLYLNTFPFSSGESLNEYLLNDKIAVILQEKNHPVIKQIFDNKQDKEYKRIFAYDEEDYIELADAIIKNKDIQDFLISQRKNYNKNLVPEYNKESSSRFISAITSKQA